MTPTHTHGGGIDQTAIIGHAPESRDWTPDQPSHHPEIADTARIEAYATIDAGTQRQTVIGPHAWIMKHAHVGHDAWIGKGVEIGTSSVIGGHAVIAYHARIGIRAVILPHRKVGARAVVGAGSVVTRDVPPGVTVAGNPARIIATNPVPHTERDDDDRQAKRTASALRPEPGLRLIGGPFDARVVTIPFDCDTLVVPGRPLPGGGYETHQYCTKTGTHLGQTGTHRPCD